MRSSCCGSLEFERARGLDGEPRYDVDREALAQAVLLLVDAGPEPVEGLHVDAARAVRRRAARQGGALHDPPRDRRPAHVAPVTGGADAQATDDLERGREPPPLGLRHGIESHRLAEIRTRGNSAGLRLEAHANSGCRLEPCRRLCSGLALLRCDRAQRTLKRAALKGGRAALQSDDPRLYGHARRGGILRRRQTLLRSLPRGLLTGDDRLFSHLARKSPPRIRAPIRRCPRPWPEGQGRRSSLMRMRR